MTVKTLTLTLTAATGVLVLTAAPALAAEESLFDSQAWIYGWRIVNFLILAGLIFKVAKAPAGDFFRSKREEAEAILAELEDAKNQAQIELDDLKARLARADEEIVEIVDQLKSMAVRNREKILEDAKRLAEEILDQARASADNEIVRAKQRLVDESGQSVIEKASELLKQRLSSTDHERLVEESLVSMGTAKAH